MSSTERFGEEANYSKELRDTTSSDSSLQLKEYKPIGNRPTRDYSRKLYKSRSKPYQKISIRKKYHHYDSYKSKSTTDCCKIEDVENNEPFNCSVYIAAFKDNVNGQIDVRPFADVLENIAMGKTRIQKTYCGIIVAFAKEEDANKIMTLSLQTIFGYPVQAIKFPNGFRRSSHTVIVKDVPWCISNVEVQQALRMQGIKSCKVTRAKNHVKVELLNWLEMQRLLAEGFNFFNHTSFQAVSESSINQVEPNIVQCFKCQGFWHTSTHCRQIPRCVRCGQNHDVAYCPRPRSAPICCHCGGPHHAAYKLCPVRLQHINSLNVRFQLSKGKPAGFLQRNII